MVPHVFNKQNLKTEKDIPLTTQLSDKTAPANPLIASSKRNRLVQFTLHHLELILIFSGLAVIALIPVLFTVDADNIGYVIVITAIVVGGMNGTILWLVRRQQRLIRREVTAQQQLIRRRAIAQMRAMLHDRVKNHLSTIALNIYLSNMPEQRAQRIRSSIEAITQELDNLSEESLTDWKERYENIPLA